MKKKYTAFIIYTYECYKKIITAHNEKGQNIEHLSLCSTLS